MNEFYEFLRMAIYLAKGHEMELTDKTRKKGDVLL